MGQGPHFFNFCVVLCLFVLCRSVYCLFCVVLCDGWFVSLGEWVGEGVDVGGRRIVIQKIV
jgi:hypothetical protein